jgi:hypothetical protein
MPQALSRSGELRVAAKVIRADGRIEDLGTIGYWHKNPLRRLWWRLRQRRR